MSIKSSSIFLLVLCAISFLGNSCQPKVQYHRITGQTMGTYYAITFEGNEPKGIQAEIEKILIDFNNSVSTYIKTSTISKLNQSEEGFVLPSDDPYFLPVLKRSKEMYQLTEGALNTSVAPLVNYWGFGYKGKEHISRVDSMAVDSLLRIVKQSSFTSERRGDEMFIAKSIPQAEIDFSSLAKGYGIDVVAGYFDNQGLKNYLIDIGGEARAKGINSKGKPWTLAINKPKDDAEVNEMEIVLELKDRAIATSGNYRIFYEKEGKKFAHILDPETGFSALSNLLSASIIADDCMTADGLATAMMVKGLEGAKDFLGKNDFPACLIYDADGDDDLEKFYANGFQDLVLNVR